MARDLEAELAESSSEAQIKVWKPMKGETLVGTVKRFTSRESAYGQGIVKVVIVRKDSGSLIAVWLTGVILKRLFDDEAVQVGERIGLKFVDQHPTKKYKVYTLVVDRDEA